MAQKLGNLVVASLAVYGGVVLYWQFWRPLAITLYYYYFGEAYADVGGMLV